MTEEMLVPDGLRFARLTAASLAILNDTGNFMADWKKAQPLVWGDMESIDSNLIDDFATKDPQQYPEYYNADVPVSNDKFYAGFNFKYFGSTSTMQTPYCPNPDVRYCDKPEFYNKQGKSVIGSSESFGYIPFVNPNYTCPSSTATLPTTEPNENTLCGEYNCESYQKFTIKVNKDTSGKDWEEVTCTSSNINQVFNIHINGKIQRKVKCVNPERFCRSVILSEMMLRKNPMDKNSWQLSDIGPKQFDSNVRKSIRKDIKTNEDEALNEQRWGNVEAWFRKNKIGFAIGCGIFVVAIIIVVVGILAYKRLHPKEENNEDNENKEMSSEYSDQTPVA
ncbi:hypothetical protein TVAG_412280 [Trichomonas vaginalis G3]|uniref:GP63-like n=1 Tax=Trichomonas vaginalis (strain ATCC PRA-98 / G3) TaxID=412133 RepID=A2F1N4_TRIV3|nr:regulation of choline O-acetyltransferase protein [Trichomonas vaginalis G3]EAY01199.1 hypothetical protein TVAG_412280 [Trichomonas vaginalis G3]KAI5513187.1 regulation of choline O-acetyltransferase protein [Trichomonas vaginalis G3]|eukprot:XP_001314035.1 hypothetical protein [Trichomonas vaginalis G3]